MAIMLQLATASQEVPLGHFVDDTDGKTAETGLTIANTDIKLWKAGATTLANKNSGGATHISGGVYYAVLDATDTNTAGPMVIFVHVAGALPVRVECHVGPLSADAIALSGDSVAADNLEAILDGTGGVVLKLAQLLIVATGNNNAIDVTGSGTGSGARFLPGASGTAAIYANGGTGANSMGFYALGNGSGHGFAAVGGLVGNGIYGVGGANSGDGMKLEGNVASFDLNIENGSVNGLTTTVADGALTANKFTTGALTAAKFASDAMDAIAAAVLDEILAGHVVGGSVALALVDAQAGSQLAGSTTAANNLRDGALALKAGAAVAGTLSTTQMTTNVTGLAADAVVGRLVTFLPAGALQFQQRRIIDYVAANGLITLDAALTQAPTAAMTFIIQ